jgi:DNA-directed RNA polymerase specialized sigma subunit
MNARPDSTQLLLTHQMREKLAFGIPMFFAANAAAVKVNAPEPPTVEELGNRDLELWHSWDSGGRKKKDLKPLLKAVQPVIRTRMNPWLNVNIKGIPKEVIKSKFEDAAIQAIKTFDPTRKTTQGSTIKLSTYMTYKLRDAEHYLKRHQNVGTIPDNRDSKIGQLQTTYSLLEDQLGREPTAFELAEELKWPEREVSRLQEELRPDYTASRSIESATQIPPDLDDMHMRLIKYELPEDEKMVYQHLMGIDGFEQLRPGQIAMRYGKSPAWVSTVKNKIEKRFKQRGA